MNDRPRTAVEARPEGDAEQRLAEWLSETAPTREPATLVPNVIARTALTGRRSRWLVPDLWRDLVRAGPPRTLIASLGVGVAASLALLVVLAASLAGLLERQEGLEGFPSGTLVVGADRPEPFDTITGALAEADEGATIAILPGEYRENLVIDRSIDLRGAGRAGSIVLLAADASKPVIELDGANAVVADFTIGSPGSSVVIGSGSVTIEGMTFDGVGRRSWDHGEEGWEALEDAIPAVRVEQGASATITDSAFIGGGDIVVTGPATARILDNVLRDGPAIRLEEATSETVVRGNRIHDPGRVAITVAGSSELVVEANSIEQQRPGIGISVGRLRGSIRDNEIRGPAIGLQLQLGARPTVTGNVIDASLIALEIHQDVNATFGGNELCGGTAIISGGALPIPSAQGQEPPDLSRDLLCDSVPLTSQP